VVQSGEHLGDSGRVGNHADGSHDLGQISSGNDGGRLIVDTNFESSRAPVNELNGSLGLDGSNGSIDVFGDDITSIQHRASHVFTVTGVTFGHHGCGFESRVGNLGNGELFVISLLSGDDRAVRGQHEVDTGIRYQVSLELSDINVQSTIESQRGSQRGDDLSDESVQVGVSGSFNIQLSSADIIDGFVIEDNGDIGMFE